MCETGLNELTLKEKRTSVKSMLQRSSLRRKDKKMNNVASTIHTNCNVDDYKFDMPTEVHFSMNTVPITCDDKKESGESAVETANGTGAQADIPDKQPLSALLRPVNKSTRNVQLNFKQHRSSQRFEHVKHSKSVQEVPISKDSTFQVSHYLQSMMNIKKI